MARVYNFSAGPAVLPEENRIKQISTAPKKGLKEQNRRLKVQVSDLLSLMK